MDAKSGGKEKLSCLRIYKSSKIKQSEIINFKFDDYEVNSLFYHENKILKIADFIALKKCALCKRLTARKYS